MHVHAKSLDKFVDMVLALEVWRETGRKVQFLVAAKSMKQRVIGFFARMSLSSTECPLGVGDPLS